jgi:hypothetical protein
MRYFRSVPDIQPAGAAGDAAGADPGLTRALTAYAADGGAYGVLAALAHARIFIPVVAVAGETETSSDGLVHDTSADVSVVLFQRPDGKRALLAFTSVAAMSEWNAEARPRVLTAREAARAALDEGAEALLLDIDGPVRFAAEKGDLQHLTADHQIVATPSGYGWFALP